MSKIPDPPDFLDVTSVKEHVRALNPPCTCPACNPEAFDPKSPCRRFRGIQTVSRPTQIDRVPWLTPASYEDGYLAEQTIRYISRQGRQAYKRQKDALKRWKALTADGDLLTRPEAQNMRNRVSIQELREMLSVFIDLYFYGAVKNVRIVWANRFSKTNRFHELGLAVTERSSQSSTLFLNPTLHHTAFGKERSSSEILSTLLHEALHCFVEQFSSAYCGDWSCGSCQLIGAKGSPSHGRAWQAIAMKLEEVVPDQLGFKLNMARFLGVAADLNDGWHWPSHHDLVVWGFDIPA